MGLPHKEIAIPKEEAVFRLDGNGRWHNQHGPFRHKKIIDYFHASIQQDELGFFVGQLNGNVREKVYFNYEDTALFVFEVISGPPIELILNTTQRIGLDTSRLFSKGDHLYLEFESGPVKFTDRALMKIATYLEEREGVLYFASDSTRHKIRNTPL